MLAPVVYLAGPLRDTAGGLLPHPFTHHLCRALAGRRPSAGLLSVALDMTGAYAARPSGCWPERPFRIGEGRPFPVLASPDFSLPGGDPPDSDGSDGPNRVHYTPKWLLGRPRPTRTIFVGLKRISTFPTRLQRPCQQGSSPTSGSNHTPVPLCPASITPS